jgi:YcxB-like protein
LYDCFFTSAPQLKRDPLGSTNESLMSTEIVYRYSSPWAFKEHQRALRAMSAVTIRRQPWKRLFRLAFPVLLLAFIMGPQLLRDDPAIDSNFAANLALWLVLILAWAAVIRWGDVYLATRRVHKLDPSTKGTLVRTLSDEGFRVDGSGVSVELQWAGIHSAVETPEFFLIFMNKLAAYYIPKVLISQSGEIARVRQLLSARLGDRAQLEADIGDRAA